MARLARGRVNYQRNVRALRREGKSESAARSIANAYAAKGRKPRTPRIKTFTVQGIGW
jgi:hypothetical protein